MILEKVEGGGGVNKKVKDEIFFYIKSVRLSFIFLRIYYIYKKKFVKCVYNEEESKKKRKGGGYIMLVYRIFLFLGLMRYRVRC